MRGGCGEPFRGPKLVLTHPASIGVPHDARIGGFQDRPLEHEDRGLLVTHMTVGVSQNRSNTLRRVSPACRES